MPAATMRPSSRAKLCRPPRIICASSARLNCICRHSSSRLTNRLDFGSCLRAFSTHSGFLLSRSKRPDSTVWTEEPLLLIQLDSGHALGELLTQLMGEPLGELLRELLTQPLGECMGSYWGSSSPSELMSILVNSGSGFRSVCLMLISSVGYFRPSFSVGHLVPAAT